MTPATENPSVELALLTFGFSLFPIETEGAHEACRTIALPHVSLVRHRPMLEIFDGCVDGAPDEGLKARHDTHRHVWTIDVAGLSAAFEHSSHRPARVVRSAETPTGHTPRCPESDMDFTIVPDFETMCSGLSLGPDVTSNDFIAFDFQPEGGTIGGIVDEHACEKVWRWSLDNKDDRHRVTGITYYHSDPLPSNVLVFKRRGGTALGTITLKPAAFDRESLVIAILVHPVVDEDGEPKDDPEENAVNLSHLHAMTQVCEVDKHASVKAVFGELLHGADAGNAARVQQLRPAFLREAFKLLAKFSPAYKGNPSCSGRRMLVRG